MAFTPSSIVNKKKYEVPTQIEQTLCSDRDAFYIFNSFIKHRESRNIEFKAAQGHYISNTLPTVLAKYACAFVNGEGGTMYLGVLDDGTVKGIPWNDRFDHRNIHSVVRRTLESFLPSTPSYSVRIVPVYTKNHNHLQYKELREIPNKRVVRIEIHQGDLERIWENGDHKVWVRRDGSVEELNPLQIKDLAIYRYKQTLNMRGAKRKHDSK